METAVFTGAGISGDPPACLPRGNGLRNDVLAVMYRAAAEAAPTIVTADQFDRLRNGPYKLEVVLGRLWGTVGSDALRCLLALRLDVPNEAHLLAAIHLARGGTHVTLNFDVGIELGYALLTGHAELPSHAPPEFRDALVCWRQLIGDTPAPLNVVAGHDAFVRWRQQGCPAALLKIHGSLADDQDQLVDVVVVDIEELGQLTQERLDALGLLRHADRLLITGYSGGDPDVYQPLLQVVRPGDCDWYCVSLPTDSSVPADATSHGIRLVLGDPDADEADGRAVTALRGLLDLPSGPPWPRLELAREDYRQRFDRWALWLRSQHSPDRFGQAWAWLLADLGDLDTAERLLAHLTSTSADPSAMLRHAEILYSRARNDDRDRAATMFRQVRDTPQIDLDNRYHCMLRLGDVGRGNAIRHPSKRRILSDLATAYGQPFRVLIETRGGRHHSEAGGDAYRALQQTSLRILERLASTAPRPVRPLVGLLCSAVSVLGLKAEGLVANGNRRALVRTHRMHLQAMAAFLTGNGAATTELATQVRALHVTYRNADDWPGAANCTVTLAVLAAAAGDPAAANAYLTEARDQYSKGRPDGEPIASGAALLAVITRMLGAAAAAAP